MTSGIYCIENKVNGKKYIGQSKELETRIRRHIRELDANKHFNIFLQRAWNKYGKENFKSYILEECPLTPLSTREMFYIKKFNSKNKKNGYNLTEGGEGLVGRKWTKEQIEARSGENHPLFGKPAANKGVPMSKDQIKKLSGENHWDTRGKNNPMYGKKGKESPMFGKKMKGSSSKYLGVSFSTNGKNIYWEANISVNGKRKYIVKCRSEVRAAFERDSYIIKSNLSDPLNFSKVIYFILHMFFYLIKSFKGNSLYKLRKEVK